MPGDISAIPPMSQLQRSEASPSPTTQSCLEGLSTAAHTISFLDWDDTLLPSTYLQTRGESEPFSIAELESLKRIQERTIQVLNIAITAGDVYIITNAEKGWVELSCKRYLPEAVSLLERVSIISARSIYDTEYPQSPIVWKICAFAETLNAHSFVRNALEKNRQQSPPPSSTDEAPLSALSSFSFNSPSTPFVSKKNSLNFVDYSTELRQSPSFKQVQKISDSTAGLLNIISIGDSNAERLACQSATGNVQSKLGNSITVHSKCLKLKDCPSPVDLNLQLEMVLRCFRFIVNHDSELDLSMVIAPDAIKLVYNTERETNISQGASFNPRAPPR